MLFDEASARAEPRERQPIEIPVSHINLRCLSAGVELPTLLLDDVIKGGKGWKSRKAVFR
jgi:hypothetical protein